jgi:hypothetical protein
MKKNSSILLLSILIIFIFVTTVISSDNWIEYGKDAYGNIISYKIVNIDRNEGKHIIKIWYKIVYSVKGKERLLQLYEKDGVTPEEHEKLSTDEMLCELDCRKRTMHYPSRVSYDIHGNELASSTKFLKSNFIRFMSNQQMIGFIENRVCK